MSDQTWPLFKVGQRVYHKAQGVHGRVVSMDWDGILWFVTVKVDDTDRKIVEHESGFVNPPEGT